MRYISRADAPRHDFASSIFCCCRSHLYHAADEYDDRTHRARAALGWGVQQRVALEHRESAIDSATSS
jgi:hypothetical protein